MTVNYNSGEITTRCVKGIYVAVAFLILADLKHVALLASVFAILTLHADGHLNVKQEVLCRQEKD